MPVDPACFICTPALCVHGEQSVTAEEVYQASIEEQLAAAKSEVLLMAQRCDARVNHVETLLTFARQERDQLQLELATAIAKSKEGWRNLAAFEREVLRAYRRSKKSSGYVPRARKPKVVIP